MVKSIGTHGGAFHCDEVFGCVMLWMLPDRPTGLDTHDGKPRYQIKTPLSSCVSFLRQALSSMLSRNSLNPADIVVVYKLYSQQ